MQQTRAQKEALVKEVTEKVKGSKALVFANFQGVPVKDLTLIRQELKKSGSSWQVLKKTLLNLALKDAGLAISARDLAGQIGVAFSQDEVAAAKVLVEYIKKNPDIPITVEGGALGTRQLSVDEIKTLAKIPSLHELRGILVGTLAAPISGFVRTLSANMSGLVQVLRAVSEKKQA